MAGAASGGGGGALRSHRRQKKRRLCRTRPPSEHCYYTLYCLLLHNCDSDIAHASDPLSLSLTRALISPVNKRRRLASQLLFFSCFRCFVSDSKAKRETHPGGSGGIGFCYPFVSRRRRVLMRHCCTGTLLYCNSGVSQNKKNKEKQQILHTIKRRSPRKVNLCPRFGDKLLIISAGCFFLGCKD